jgi:hypothetical protein
MCCRDVVEIFAIFNFVYRACNYPGDVFQKVEASVDLDDVMAGAYKLYDTTFEGKALSYNTHLWFEHTLDSR